MRELAVREVAIALLELVADAAAAALALALAVLALALALLPLALALAVVAALHALLLRPAAVLGGPEELGDMNRFQTTLTPNPEKQL